jgi:phosphoheptose isomerase
MFDTIAGNAKDYLASLNEATRGLNTAEIDKYGDLLFEVWKRDSNVFVIGNGGSACNASHHVTDYIKTARVAGCHALRAECLTDNFGLFSAVGNDLSYDDVFTYALQAKAKSGDILVAISCSGNSGNIVSAVEWAKGQGMETVCLTGFQGGKIGAMGSIHINVPHENYGVIEDLQLSVGHIAAQILRSKIEKSKEQ